MSFETNVKTFATRVGTEFKTLRTQLTGNGSGSLAGLTTDAKSSLIAAINELDAAIEALAGAEGGATIVDGTPVTTSVWSSAKTDSEINAAIDALISAAPGALDTLNELAAALGDDPNFASTITAQIAAKVSLTGNETIGGVKTFSNAPVVPDNSFGVSKINGLQTSLDSKLDSVVSGENISVDVTDPRNPVINSYAPVPTIDEVLVAGFTATDKPVILTTADDTATTTVSASAVGIHDTTGTVQMSTAVGLELFDSTGTSRTSVNISRIDFGTAEKLTVIEPSTGGGPEAILALPSESGQIALTTDIPGNASDTVAGVVELATNAETVTGVDASRAVTPAGLAAVVGDSTENFVTTFETALI